MFILDPTERKKRKENYGAGVVLEQVGKNKLQGSRMRDTSVMAAQGRGRKIVNSRPAGAVWPDLVSKNQQKKNDMHYLSYHLTSPGRSIENGSPIFCNQ